jgi:hypothetical protein
MNAANISRKSIFMVISAPDGRKEYHSKHGRVSQPGSEGAAEKTKGQPVSSPIGPFIYVQRVGSLRSSPRVLW